MLLYKLCVILHPSPARQGSYVEGAVRGARQVSSGARSRLACPQFPSPRPGRAVTWKGRCVGPCRYPRVPGLALHVHSSPSPARQGSYVEGAVRGARQVSSGARSRLACPQFPLPGPAGQLRGRGGAWGPAGILGCPVSPCMSTSAPALRYPWLLAGDVVEVWVRLQFSNDAARDAMVLFLQCRGTSVHRQRSKVTLGCLPGPTHLLTKRSNCPCRASATPEPGDEEKWGRYDVRWHKCP